MLGITDNPRILLVMYGPAADVKEKSFIQRLGTDAVMYLVAAGSLCPAGLMQSALPLLINPSAFADPTNTRVWGSWSDHLRHHG